MVATQFTDLAAGTFSVTLVWRLSRPSSRKTSGELIRTPARAVDAQMQVADVKETVVVTSDATVPLQTDWSDVNITQTTRQVNADLPLTGSLGRNYQSLMVLVPGSVSAGEQNSAAETRKGRSRSM